MPFIGLAGGAYQARSLIAAAQRCLNLFIEPIPRQEGEPFGAAHFCTPGTTFQATAPSLTCRCLYTASNGTLYGVWGQAVMTYSADGVWTYLGSFQPTAISDAVQRLTPVSMCDNLNVLLICDGSVDGWYVDITLPVGSQGLNRIDRGINLGWLGSDFISYQDTFFIMNSPGTEIFYISLSNITAQTLTEAYTVYSASIVTGGASSSANYSAGDILTLNGTGGAQITVNTVDAGGGITGYGVTSGGAVASQPSNPVTVTGGTGNGATFNLAFETNQGGFDPLDFAGMSAQANKLVCAISMHRNVWLIGTTSYEVWINTGGDGTSQGSFPFAIYPEAFGNWGCVAKYSVIAIFNQIFWLSQDKYGIGMIMRAEGLQATRVSTHAIEHTISEYPTITDCVAMAYQQGGHQFVLFTFPSANNARGATWCFDTSTGEWHERAWIDSNGLEYRHPANAIACAYDQVWVGDWRNQNLCTFDLDNYTDQGNPIVRKRSFPHQIDLEASRRISYQQLIAQMQVGSATQTGQPQTITRTDFNNPNGTDLASYYNLNDIGASFIDTGAVTAIIMNDAVVATEAGSVTYAVASTGVLTDPDYTVSFSMVPDSYSSVPANGAFVSVVGRAYGTGGYQAAIASDGSQYYVILNVLDTMTSAAVDLGTLAAETFDVTLTMIGTGISVSVYRRADGYWMGPLGSWVPSPATAIAIDDATWTLPGIVLIGGNWE